MRIIRWVNLLQFRNISITPGESYLMCTSGGIGRYDESQEVTFTPVNGVDACNSTGKTDKYKTETEGQNKNISVIDYLKVVHFWGS